MQVSASVALVKAGEVFEEAECEVLERFEAVEVETGKKVTGYRAPDGTLYIGTMVLDASGRDKDGTQYATGAGDRWRKREANKRERFMENYGVRGKSYDSIIMDDLVGREASFINYMSRKTIEDMMAAFLHGIKLK